MILILIRHARTATNARSRLQGRYDPPLDELGLAQAELMGREVRGRWSIDRLVVTSRRRARETAEMAGLDHLPTTEDDRWREIDFGDHEDRSMAELIEELGRVWLDDVEYVHPAGESISVMHERVGEALEPLLVSAHEQNIAIVTHATPVKSAVARLLGAGVETVLRLRVDLASVTAFVPAGGRLVLRDYNWCPARGLGGPSGSPTP